MKEEQIKAMLDTVEKMGFKRGVMSICKQILETMEEEKITHISYKSIKGILEEYLKLN